MKPFVRLCIWAAVFWGAAAAPAFCAGGSDAGQDAPGVFPKALPGVSSETSPGALPELPLLESLFDGGYWVTRPADGVITVIGMTGRRANREDAVKAALLDAARKAALYHGLYAESVAVLNQGAGTLDYFSDFDYRLELQHDPEEFVDALVFDRERDVLEKNGLVTVRVRYAGVSDVPAYETVLEEGVPDWTKNYAAVVPGYLAGIGYSKNKGTVQKTCQASYENALVSLLPQLSARVDTATIDADGGGRVIQNVTRSEGTLTGVMILETWFDRRVNAVWTLVVARAP
jgi:hypothetical protein